MGKDWPWKLCLAVVSVVTLSLIYRSRRRRWQPVGVLSKIYIYPFKSGKYREVSSAECSSLGLRCPMPGGLLTLRDRVFTVYTETKQTLVTARMYPTLIFISTEPTDRDSFIFSHPDKEDIEVSVPKEKFNGDTVTFFKSEKVQFVDCGDELARWVSELALKSNSGLRVGYWPEQETWRRDALAVSPEEKPVFKNFTNLGTGAFTDLASYMLINQSSIDEMNERMEDKSDNCEVLNFRPNFLVEGVPPNQEDKWEKIKIGEVEFTNFRPCTRCIFTTINYKTAEKNKNMEPLKTMRTYRTMSMLGESRIEPTTPVMGIFMSLDKAGTVKAGDTVYIV